MMKPLSRKELELGVETVLLKRASHQRIPRLLKIKKRVDAGARLTDYQINFLTRVFEDAEQIGPFINHHPEFQEIATRMVSLYHDITEQALKNEEANLNKRAPRIDLGKQQS